MAADMQPSVRQPIGFWSARAGEAIRARTRGRLAEIGVTQPQWWLLHQLSLHPDGMGDERMVEVIGPNDSDDAIRAAIREAIANGWVARTNDVLSATPAGRDIFRTAADGQQDLEAERRQGISDVDYVTTSQVLQRTIENVGGSAWHW